ncbi:MAG TPA: ABC transporter ATP-binding protein [Candidatus Limnocylindria bacterium]|nr:ABC transporter ATP-binding protein [Candidatus Limnocylindria bacterium]
MTPLLELRGLTKHVRDHWTMRRTCILEDLSLALEEGELFGLIGHNGAGKTTTFKLVLGFLRPSAGSVLFAGRPLDVAARRSIGFLPESPYFYDYLTVEEALGFYANLYGLTGAAGRQRCQELLAELHLEAKRHAKLRTLSKGTLQRLGVAQAIVARPRLLILDEPMSGLDPAGRHHMRELIRTLQQEGTTVVFSSHILPDAEALCSRVGILARGRLRDVVRLDHEADPHAYLLAVRRVSADALEVLERLAAAPPQNRGDTWQVRLPDSAAVRAAMDAVRASSASVESLTPVRASLEERFLAYVSESEVLDG